MSQPVPGPASQAQLPPVGNLLKPDQIAKVEFLPKELRAKYTTGITGLWKMLESHAPASQEYRDIHQKLFTATMSFRQTVKLHQQQQAGGTSAGTTSTTTEPAVAPTNGGGTAARREGFSPRVLQQVREMAFVVPPSIQSQGQAETAKYLNDIRLKYANMVAKLERETEHLAALDRVVKERKAAGRPLTAAEEQQYTGQRNNAASAQGETSEILQQFHQKQNQLRAATQQAKIGVKGEAEEAPRNNGSQDASAARAADPPKNPTAATRPPPAFPLSHEAAMQQARSFPGANTSAGSFPASSATASTTLPPSSAVLPPTSTTSSTAPIPKPAGGPPARESQLPSSINHAKMPIPRDAPIQVPQPVAMGSMRPTMTNGPHVPGPLGQPAIQKHPGYVLEGEGERVLSKKKLEELVRQVTGSSSGDAAEGETLTAEVEEVADDFVDQVITSACKLAKLRNSPTLELRDLQLILERNYNIRVPGFASDEVRAVRKIAPAPAWAHKLGAVQAAKVTAGRTG